MQYIKSTFLFWVRWILVLFAALYDVYLMWTHIEHLNAALAIVLFATLAVEAWVREKRQREEK